MDKMILSAGVEIKNRLIVKKSRTLSHIFLYYMIFLTMTDRLIEQVYYILDAHWYGEYSQTNSAAHLE